VVEAARSARYDRPLALCLFDLDGFKAINDRYGHPAGDEVLRGVAEVIDSSRLTDDAFRIGGDEFAVLMPETKLEGAKIAGRRLAEALAHAKLGEDGSVTASYGVAATVGDALSLHDAADRALLAAKRKQRAAAA
jgi:diguanylate cyclase (GGDEF)-like protein